jgi:NADPH:quinone reductase-like Zn-dependent oxidoreductase
MAVAANGSLATMPEGRDYIEMAPAGEGATYALSIIKAAGVKDGQKVLVYGASGAIGSAAVQILRHMGVQVTAVCGTKNVELIKSIGAHKVISFETEDFTLINDTFDLVLDAVGKTSYGATKKLLNSNGKYCSSELGKDGQNPLMAIWFALTGSNKVIFPIPKINQEQIQIIQQLVEVGAFKPVVDRVYALDEIVEAAAYVETGQKTGNVVIKVN